MFWYAHLALGPALASFITADPLMLGLAALFSVLPDLDKPFGHRRWFSHSLLAAAIFGSAALVASGFAAIYALIAFLSVASHVGLDFLTKSGVPLLHPLRKNHYGLRLFSAHDQRVNRVVAITGLLILLFSLWMSHSVQPVLTL